MRKRSLLTTITLLASSACSGGGAEVPESFGTEAAIARGRAYYRQSCALCHGERGDGAGVRSSSLVGSPTDFTSRPWHARAYPEDVHRILRDGVSGTSMPSWRALGDEALWDLTSYVLSLGDRTR